MATGVKKDKFAYGFVRCRPGKSAPEAFHHRQEQDRLDVAFDITWTTQTPTALQPCEDVSVSPSATDREGENIGYNKRWLLVDGKPAISPFTVKGAIANGVANLLGGCYRVPDREEGHNSALNASTYPYTGAWKRYRVSNKKSLPGILREINVETGYVKVQPVTEYYWDEPNLPFNLASGDTCHAAWTVDRWRNLISRLAPQGGQGPRQGQVTYYGSYRFGMDLRLMPGDMNKRHHHRFYSVCDAEIDGQVPLLSLVPEEKLLEKVYGGQYCKGDPKELKVQRMRDRLGRPWYEKLRDLKSGDLCYYTVFADESGRQKIAAIGKNFQFKALFNHGKTLPLGNDTCVDAKNLCPRCALFGITDKCDDKGKGPVGYAGRFKAATLVSSHAVSEQKIADAIPAKETLTSQRVEMALWNSSDRQIIRQFALPIMGPPKPSKRDMDGYFDKQTGMVKGAKRYHHAVVDFESLPNLIRLATTDEGMSYAHQMRPVAAVCREGIEFYGTVGAENCSAEEIAALLALLDHRAGGHAFKLGLGKNIGLGSVRSRIGKVWVRRAGGAWESATVPNDEKSREELFAILKELLPDALEVLESIINSDDGKARLHSDAQPEARLRSARAVEYWKEAQVETLPR